MTTAIIFDTEWHKMNGDIIAAAWMRVGIKNGHLISGTVFEGVNCDEQFYQPSEPISFTAMSIHHILDEELEGKPYFTEFQFPSFPDSQLQYVIGHNVDGDLQAAYRAGADISRYKPICTLSMCRNLWPEVDSHSLTSVAYYLCPDKKAIRQQIRNAHSASGDCLITHYVLDTIIRQEGIQSLEELFEFSEKNRLPRYMYRGNIKGTAIVDISNKDLMHWLGRTDIDPPLKKALELEQERRQHNFQDHRTRFTPRHLGGRAYHVSDQGQ